MSNQYSDMREFEMLFSQLSLIERMWLCLVIDALVLRNRVRRWLGKARCEP